MLVYQCYQIGRFLKVLGDTFMFKSHPNVWRLFGLIWKASLFSNNCYGYLFSNVLISFGYSLFQHLVTLLVLNIYLNWLALSIITHLPTYLKSTTTYCQHHPAADEFVLVPSGDQRLPQRWLILRPWRMPACVPHFERAWQDQGTGQLDHAHRSQIP